METFEQFMQRALHHPEHGYYARRITNVGGRGDFTTAPMLSTLPAKAIAAWAIQSMRETGCLNLIEIGPGEGRLARDVLRHLPFWQRMKTRLHLVETSHPLIERQKELLGKRAQWHKDMPSALAACGGCAVIYSNELVDAFPVRRFQKTPLGWQELALDWIDDRPPLQVLLKRAELPESSSFSQQYPLGQWIEVHQSYQRWLAEWLDHWQAGKMLTIDYGATSGELYHRRPQGSIRAYLLQHRIEGHDIYQNIGRQDLTADVNFTDLIQWGETSFHSPRLQTFTDFLCPHAQTHELLLAVEGAGGAFRVLEQTRNSIS